MAVSPAPGAATASPLAPATPMGLSPTVLALCNQQLNLERQAKAAYYAAAAWADSQFFPGLRGWLLRSGDEEDAHARQQFEFINDRARATITGLPDPFTEFDSYVDVLQTILDLEVLVATRITEIATVARGEGDEITAIFYATFLDDQRRAMNEITGYITRVNRGAPIDLLDGELFEG